MRDKSVTKGWSYVFCNLSEPLPFLDLPAEQARLRVSFALHENGYQEFSLSAPGATMALDNIYHLPADLDLTKYVMSSCLEEGKLAWGWKMDPQYRLQSLASTLSRRLQAT